ncbi:MAG: ABC transporter permease [Oscillospiraceae bacterium]|nr:ABC transporter permease [Oscillospiraceae bacterium]
MTSILLAMQGAVSQGILWSVMALGVFITFKVLDCADMTVDGSFALGGAVSAVMILKGVDPFLSLFIAVAAGMIAGTVTAVLNTKLQIPILLAGILTQLALYSVNIRVMGQPNTPLNGVSTIVTILRDITSMQKSIITLILGIVIAAALVFILYWFFGTELGSAIRATGNNEYMVRALGVNTDMMKIIGLFLGNGLVALSGALVGQSQGYADVQMGQGAIVIGLASIIIGEVIFDFLVSAFKFKLSFAHKLLSVIIGSILYRLIIAIVLQLGMKSTDLKLLTATIVAAALALPVLKSKLPSSKNKKIAA